jgi:hypothetical protein
MRWRIRHFLHKVWPSFWFRHADLKIERTFRLRMRLDRDEAIQRMPYLKEILIDWDAIEKDFARVGQDMARALEEVGRAFKP